MREERSIQEKEGSRRKVGERENGKDVEGAAQGKTQRKTN